MPDSSSLMVLAILVITSNTSIGVEAGFSGGNSSTFTPTVDPDTNSAACAEDPPSAVLSVADLCVGIPDNVPGAVVCGFGCTNYVGCTSYNYKQLPFEPARCEFYTFNIRYRSASTNGQCQHFQITGQQPLNRKSIVAGEWGDWIESTNCTVVGQLTFIEARSCDNPPPSGGGSACINSTGGSALIEYRQTECDTCDPNCNSTCSTYGFLTCDGSCTDGYGIDNTSHTCKECNSTGCNDSCNIYGPGTCDGRCATGFVFDQISHNCSRCPNGYTYVADANSCYKYVMSTKKSYADALQDCRTMNNGTYLNGSHLAYIETQNEQTAIFNFIGGQNSCPTFIGGCRTSHTNGTFLWSPACVSGIGPPMGTQTKNMTFTWWYSGDPNDWGYTPIKAASGEWCVAIWQCSNGNWADVSCENKYSYLCEVNV